MHSLHGCRKKRFSFCWQSSRCTCTINGLLPQFGRIGIKPFETFLTSQIQMRPSVHDIGTTRRYRMEQAISITPILLDSRCSSHSMPTRICPSHHHHHQQRRRRRQGCQGCRGYSERTVRNCPRWTNRRHGRGGGRNWFGLRSVRVLSQGRSANLSDTATTSSAQMSTTLLMGRSFWLHALLKMLLNTSHHDQQGRICPRTWQKSHDPSYNLDNGHFLHVYVSLKGWFHNTDRWSVSDTT